MDRLSSQMDKTGRVGDNENELTKTTLWVP